MGCVNGLLKGKRRGWLPEPSPAHGLQRVNGYVSHASEPDLLRHTPHAADLQGGSRK